jgi:hypothetical protein
MVADSLIAKEHVHHLTVDEHTAQATLFFKGHLQSQSDKILRVKAVVGAVEQSSEMIRIRHQKVDNQEVRKGVVDTQKRVVRKCGSGCSAELGQGIPG